MVNIEPNSAIPFDFLIRVAIPDDVKNLVTGFDIVLNLYEFIFFKESDILNSIKSIFDIEANMGLEAGVGVWGVAESIFDTFWRQISNGQSLGKNVDAISQLLAYQYSDSSFLNFLSQFELLFCLKQKSK